MVETRKTPVSWFGTLSSRLSWLGSFSNRLGNLHLVKLEEFDMIYTA